MSGLETKILVLIKEEEPFYLEFADDKLSVKRGELEQSDASLKSDKRTMTEVISGRLSQEDAFNRKLIETSGSISDAMRFRYVLNKTLKKSRFLKLAQKLFSVFG